MVQWWYGHNAVGFFLTAGFLGIMYYFIPKQANRPVYSYRLSVVHFWALIFTYIWAGPHHLHYTALPDWTQSLGMVFSLILLAPSWGGMINGIMTLSGAWEKLRTDPMLQVPDRLGVVLRHVDLRGPMMSIKTVNALSHYTDWTIGHVHSGALGWVGLISIGACTTSSRACSTARCTAKLIEVHFWISTIGIVLYITAMWISGIMQGLMWRAVNTDGTLTYSFVESVQAMHPFYVIRFLGGAFFLLGMLIMAVQHLEDHSRCQTGGGADSGGAGALREIDTCLAQKSRNERVPADRADLAGHQRRRAGADRAAVLPARDHRAGGGPEALQRA
jgi:cytochrome c oxidase cbb3-type subunit I